MEQVMIVLICVSAVSIGTFVVYAILKTKKQTVHPLPKERPIEWILKNFRELSFKAHPNQIGMVRVGEMRKVMAYIDELESALGRKTHGK